MPGWPVGLVACGSEFGKEFANYLLIRRLPTSIRAAIPRCCAPIPCAAGQGIQLGGAGKFSSAGREFAGRQGMVTQSAVGSGRRIPPARL